jgi:hypothetical protein
MKMPYGGAKKNNVCCFTTYNFFRKRRKPLVLSLLSKEYFAKKSFAI